MDREILEEMSGDELLELSYRLLDKIDTLTEHADSMRDLLATIIAETTSVAFLAPTIRSTINRYDQYGEGPE